MFRFHLLLHSISQAKIATSSCQLQEFRHFPNLTLEIRMKIWRLALPGPRLVELTLLDNEHLDWRSDPNKDGQWFWTTTVPPPNLLHVSHEAREAILSHTSQFCMVREQNRMDEVLRRLTPRISSFSVKIPTTLYSSMSTGTSPLCRLLQLSLIKFGTSALGLPTSSHGINGMMTPVWKTLVGNG
jgi:2EXR family